ncbi:MAG TPA: methionine--tRNA ligase [Gemmatimonadales bacterium]|nr:methionine--tRNA ligase [Gemmatimonadales bacterium]
MARFYLTTAIDYSNGDPHLGHALEKVGADAIARWRRLRGDDVRFLMGMDEHAQSVVQAAAAGGITPQAWVDGMAATFAGFWARLATSHDDWIRTTEPRHARAVTTLLTRIRERRPDHVFLAEYEGLYCTGCEEFKQESQIVDGRCGEHPGLVLVPTREENYYFRLSAYRDEMLARIESDAFRVRPDIRRNEVLGLLKAGLQDISISRRRQPWGIPFPGDPDHTVYVWFDALINYLSATGYPDPGYERIWPADLHIVGKGITRFHCVIWPAMLLAAGVALPREVWAHGYVQWEGAKMSKTAGTAVSLATALERHGADALRYFLLREIGYENDGNFTWERFDARYTADLADTLGNLVSRSLSMIHRYRAGTVPAGAIDPALESDARAALAAYAAALDANDLSGGAALVIELAARANRYVEERAPWKLARDPGQAAALDAVLGTLARTVARLAVLALPFMPGKAAEIWDALGTGRPIGTVRWDDGQEPAVAGRVVAQPPILYPKPATGTISR